jgi:hypothetical protein
MKKKASIKGSDSKKTSPKTSAKTSTASKTATSTKTSTDAYTQGNITVTGGAGRGANTKVDISAPKGPVKVKAKKNK